LYILGINAYHGDASASIIKNGQLVAAVEEERFNRKKHCAGFPTLAIRYCLEVAGISLDQVDHIGISRDPSAHLHKKILFSLTKLASLSGLIAARLANAAKIRDLRQDLTRALGVVASAKVQFHNVEHHKAHMASCFFVSPFERAAILSIDGVQRRPWVVTDDEGERIDIRPVGMLAQSFDHRAVDGAYSGAYLRRVKQILESREWIGEFLS